MEQLNGKVAVVTGGASGIGKAVALALAAESMKVVVADIEQPPLDSTVAEMEAAGGVASGCALRCFRLGIGGCSCEHAVRRLSGLQMW